MGAQFHQGLKTDTSGGRERGQSCTHESRNLRVLWATRSQPLGVWRQRSEKQYLQSPWGVSEVVALTLKGRSVVCSVSLCFWGIGTCEGLTNWSPPGPGLSQTCHLHKPASPRHPAPRCPSTLRFPISVGSCLLSIFHSTNTYGAPTVFQAPCWAAHRQQKRLQPLSLGPRIAGGRQNLGKRLHS